MTFLLEENIWYPSILSKFSKLSWSFSHSQSFSSFISLAEVNVLIYQQKNSRTNMTGDRMQKPVPYPETTRCLFTYLSYNMKSINSPGNVPVELAFNVSDFMSSTE
jgi:hypothetical protein